MEQKESQRAIKMHEQIKVRRRYRKVWICGDSWVTFWNYFGSHFPTQIDENIDADIDTEKVMENNEKTMKTLSII